MDDGRDLLLCLPTGLDEGELVSETCDAAFSPCVGEVGEVGAVEGEVPFESKCCGDTVAVLLESSLEEWSVRGMSPSGEDAGVSDLESRCDADSCDINERTVFMTCQLSAGKEQIKMLSDGGPGQQKYFGGLLSWATGRPLDLALPTKVRPAAQTR